jgi:diguanylate cyclase (GGDEF)-like protein
MLTLFINWDNMNINKKKFSFGLVFLIAVGNAFFTIITIEKLTAHTQKMYTHPFNVSNAIANIQTSIITMHRNMKDVVLTRDSLELIQIIEDIQKEEEKVFNNFELIYKRYLGEKKDIDLSYNAFKNWKDIRQEVISLVYKKEFNKAITITKGKGARHIDNLYNQIDVLKDFAFNKAEEYYKLSLENTPLKQIILSYFLTFLIGTIIVLYVTKSLLKNNKVNKKQLYLIDQNILIAKLDLNKKIIEISSAFCCVLNIRKEDILNSSSNYFFTNESYFKKFENIIFSGKKYQGEIPIEINNEIFWYEIEILPHFSDNYVLNSFTILLTNISDKKEIEKVSITDSLTGLYNRNYFEMIFGKEIKRAKRAKREKKELSMIMIDIDYFKKYNDTYGHQEGDLALKAVSNILSTHTNRSYDYAFRIGGEEFVILSYQKDFTMLEKFADLLISEVENIEIPHRNNLSSKYVTISAGVIQFGKDNLLTTDEMYKKVDELLYYAKKSGRNNFKSLYLK